jgi:hypothetical protein
MQSEIFLPIKSFKGQPLFFLKAILKQESLEEYSSIPGDYYEYWEWEAFPLRKNEFNNITGIEKVINPEGEFSVDKKNAKLAMLSAMLVFLKEGSSSNLFMDKTVANEN